MPGCFDLPEPQTASFCSLALTVKHAVAVGVCEGHRRGHNGGALDPHQGDEQLRVLALGQRSALNNHSATSVQTCVCVCVLPVYPNLHKIHKNSN